MAAIALSSVEFVLVLWSSKVKDGTVRPRIATKNGISLILDYEKRMQCGICLAWASGSLGAELDSFPKGEMKFKK